MGAGERVASGIACGALLVAFIGLFFSAKSANASEASAQASKSSADTYARLHILELAREGIVEFGPWRAEAFDERRWRFFNVGDQAVYGLTIKGLGDIKDSGFDVSNGEEIPPGGSATVSGLPYAAGRRAYEIEARWRTGSIDGAESIASAWIRRPRPESQ